MPSFHILMKTNPSVVDIRLLPYVSPGSFDGQLISSSKTGYSVNSTCCTIQKM